MLLLLTNCTPSNVASAGRNKRKNRSVCRTSRVILLLLRKPRVPSFSREGERREREREFRARRTKETERTERYLAEVWFEPVSSCHGHATFHPNVAGYKEIDLTTIMREYLCALNERNYLKYIYIYILNNMYACTRT